MTQRIITQLNPNNHLRIRAVNLPPGSGNSKKTDSFETKRQEYLSKCINTVISYTSILESSVEIKRNKIIVENFEQPTIIPGGEYLGGKSPVSVRRSVEVEYCDLTDSIEYWDVSGDLPIKYKSTVKQLQEQIALKLDIIKKSQHPKKKARIWGTPNTLKTFTRNGRQKILSAGAIVDRTLPKECCFEVTCTIPGSTTEAMVAVSNWSGWIVNRQAQVIRRYSAKGYQIYWFFVWEHQKRGALHQHWCIGVDGHPDIAKKLAEEIKDKWFQCLLEIKDKSGEDCFSRKGLLGTWRNQPEKWQSSVNPIKKSVARYFAKYVSKNGKVMKYLKDRRRAKDRLGANKSKGNTKVSLLSLSPSRYWGSCTLLKDKIKQNTIVFTFDCSDKKEAKLILSNFNNLIKRVYKASITYYRNILVTDEKTGWIYAKGWEIDRYYSEEDYLKLYQLLKRVRQSVKNGSNISEFHTVLFDF